MEKKKIKDVISCIKPGEIWLGEFIGIEKMYDSEILIFKIDEESGIKKTFGESEVIILEEDEFILKNRRSFPIRVAVCAYKKGRCIQSLESGIEYRKEEGLDKKVSFEEIIGEWYIND